MPDGEDLKMGIQPSFWNSGFCFDTSPPQFPVQICNFADDVKYAMYRKKAAPHASGALR
jgi:hypothetical protein